jgi:RNA exonuclease NGL2
MLPHLPHHKAIRASGPGKLHGLVILYNANKFTCKATRTIYYDEEFTEGDFHAERIRVDVNKETEAETQERKKRWKKARGGTRQTKNIGLMAALEWVDKPGTGIVVGTTHL